MDDTPKLKRGSEGALASASALLSPTIDPTDPVRGKPVLSQAFDSALDAVLFAQKHLDLTSGYRPLGFILKAKTQEHYVVSQAVADKVPFLSASNVFERDALDKLILPQGFVLYGMYYAHTQDPIDLGSNEPWLQQEFFSPADLFMAIRRGEAVADTDKSAPLVIHLMSAEGAVLSYQSHNSENERLLFAKRKGTVVSGVQWLRQVLKAGLMTPRAFIRKVAAAGELRVLATTGIWDVAGRVSERWVPFSTFIHLEYSHGFLTADGAARYAREKILAMPDRHVREFGGYIVKSSHNTYFVSLPQPGEANSFQVDNLLPRTRLGVPVVSDGSTLFAYYHSHKREDWQSRARYKARLAESNTARDDLKWTLDEWDFRPCMFSAEDLTLVLSEPNYPATAYLMGSDDSLIRFTRPDSGTDPDVLTQLSGSSVADVGKKEADRVRRVAAEGELRVVVPSRLWGPAGKISANWRLSPPAQVTGYVAPPAFGGTFTALFVAVDAVHEQALQSSERRQFAYLLKHRQKDCFIATAPLPLDRLRRLPTVFEKSPEGNEVHPENFDIVGLYYCGPVASALLPLDQVQVLKNFVDPQDTALLCQEASTRCPAGSTTLLPINIGARDGALLRYTPRSIPANLSKVHVDVMCGAMTTRDYILSLVAVGQLEVRRTSDVWDIQADVTAQWKPYARLARRQWMALFANLDDAAAEVNRFLVKHPLDKTRGGVIVKRSDGLYSATKPLEGGRLVFDFDSVLPAMTSEVLAAGDEVVAVYFKPAQRKGFLAENLEESLLHNGFSPHELALGFKGLSNEKSCFYLASDGALLRYELRARPLFLTRCSPSNDQLEAIFDNAMAQDLARENLTAATFYQAVADQMNLQVIVPGAVWGTRIRLNQSAEYLPLRCSPLFRTHTDALFALDHRIVDSDALEFSLMYRHERRDEFFFTDIIPKRSIEILQARLSIATGSKKNDYGDYSIDGVCVIPPERSLVLDGVGAEHLNAVNQHFISPMDLELGLSLFPGKPIYVLPMQGGILKYQSDQAVQQIFGGAAKERFKQLSENTLTFQEYVRGLGKSGHLEVLVGGGGWTEGDVLTGEWEKPTAPVAAPDVSDHISFGAIHGNPDDALTDAHEGILSPAHMELRGALLAKPEARKFVASHLMSLSKTFFSQESLRPLLHGYSLAGLHLIHASAAQKDFAASIAGDLSPGQRYKGEMLFQPRDVCEMVAALKRFDVSTGALYLSASDGGLLKLQIEISAANEDLCGTVGEGDKGECRAQIELMSGAIKPSDYLQRLMAKGELNVLVKSVIWQPLGRFRV